MAETAGVSIGIHNRGGIRASLPSGDITRRQLYEVSPFGNKVSVCRLRGDTLRALVERGLQEGGRPLEVYGLVVQWAIEEGRPVFVGLEVGGDAVDPNSVYDVATNSYLAEGGDDWKAFPQEGPPKILDIDLYEASVARLAAATQEDGELSPIAGDAYVQVGTLVDRSMGVLGLAVLIGICFVLSRNRRRVSWRVVAWGVGLQVLFAFLVLETVMGQVFFETVKSLFVAVMDYAREGNDMVFGPLADVGALESALGRGFVFFTQILGTIVLVSTLTAILYHMGVMQLVVYSMAKVMQFTMRTSGAESLASAANVFVGQTEAPLTVRPYLAGMTSSEIMAMMTGGMATVAGGVLAAYAGFGIDAGHLLAASVMSAPAALVVAKILVPETEEPTTGSHVPYEIQRTDANLLDAACRGAGEGFKLGLNVMAMLIALVSVVALL
ncbi:MAG: 5'-nucleotidase C-terminal domain-containing protein, partial [Phycisphaerales bacterium]|nr:5'-nucleotidase C-terminal domain-containing protein [Phycisphaerales bacterium]